VSVTLDADLVAELEAEGTDNLSAQVNAALRADIARLKRQRALGRFLDRIEAEEGPLDTPEDQAEIARYMRLLGGLAEEAHDESRVAS
jgi:antitoxin CcdA